MPIGSTEQHGPHLPLETDAVVAVAVATGIAERMRRGPSTHGVLVAPALAYGASGEHQEFPGTMSIGHDALSSVLIELVRSLSTWAGRIILVNGHGGNAPSLARAIPQLIGEGHAVAWVPCTVAGGDAHAGRTETSLMLHLSPGSVDLSAAGPGNVAPIETLMQSLRSDGVRAVSASGVLGDPTGASAAEGAAILDVMVEGAFGRIASAQVDASGCLLEAGQEANTR